jgi:hypothetical protein
LPFVCSDIINGVPENQQLASAWNSSHSFFCDCEITGTEPKGKRSAATLSALNDYQFVVYLAFPHIPCLSLDASSTSFSSSHISFCLLYLSAIIVFLYYNFLIFIFLSPIVLLH